MKAYVFPGQGAQFTGMGHELYEQNPKAKELMDRADAVLGFKLTDIMFSGSEDDLKQTKVTQPAVFLHSVVLALTDPEFAPDMTAGHSLGEFSALVAAGALDFESGLKLVSARAQAMQKACEAHPSTMAAVLALPDEKVEEICAEVPGCVRAANYNCPGQVVISGEVEAIDAACAKMKEAGAKRALKLKVGGAFHSPLMEKANAEFAKLLKKLTFRKPHVPFYSNAAGGPLAEGESIRGAMLNQMTSPVRWDALMRSQAEAGIRSWLEVGPKAVLGKMVSCCLEPMGIESGSISVGLVNDLESLEKING